MKYITKRHREIKHTNSVVRTEIMLENMILEWSKFIFKRNNLNIDITEQDLKDFKEEIANRLPA